MTSAERYNAARHLRDVLASWTVGQGQTAQSARGDSEARDPEFWRAHLAVVSDLTELERILRELEIEGNDVTVWRSFMPDLYRAVFAVNTPWSASGDHRQPLDPTQMMVLEGFVQTLNQRRGSQPIAEELRDKLRQQLSDARDLVIAAGVADLDPQTRSYLLTVIDDAIAVIQLDRPAAQQRAAVQQATGAMLTVAASQSAAPQRTAFRSKLGVAALAVAATFGHSYVDGVGSHLGELTVDSVLHLLAEPTSNQLEPGATQIQIEPSPQIVDQDEPAPPG